MAVANLDPIFSIIITSVLTITLILLHVRHSRQRLKQQVRQLVQLRLLRALIAGLQRHRGLSTGVLAGDGGMRPERDTVRRELDRLVDEAPLAQSVYRDSWAAIADHWQRLRDDRDREPENNLAQHHAIIRNAIFLLQDVAAADGMASRREAYTFIWQDVIQAAEWAGQARALGTGMAAAGRSTASQRVRLRFLHQKIRQLSDRAFAALASPTSSPDSNIGRAQASVTRLLEDIEADLLVDSVIVIGAQTYFRNATTTIDALFVLVDDALARLDTTEPAGNPREPSVIQMNPAPGTH